MTSGTFPAHHGRAADCRSVLRAAVRTALMKGRANKSSVYVSLHVCILILIHGPHRIFSDLLCVPWFSIMSLPDVLLFASILGHLRTFFFPTHYLSIPFSSSCGGSMVSRGMWGVGEVARRLKQTPGSVFFHLRFSCLQNTT